MNSLVCQRRERLTWFDCNVTKSLLCVTNTASFPRVETLQLANDFGNFFAQKIENTNASLANLSTSSVPYLLLTLHAQKKQKRQRSCLRTDVSYLLCCTRKRDICVTQSLIVFKGKPLYREKTVYIKIFTHVHLLYTQIHLIFTFIK